MAQLERKISLLQATTINMTDMVGIGPFIVISVVAEAMNGPWFLYAWLAGALLSFLDATVWSELGATFPLAGGSYIFLKESYGRNWGRLMSFLFVWQTMIQAPLVIASAAIGFSQYFSFIVPLSIIEGKALSGFVVILIIILLYRRIEAIGKISVLLWVGVLITLIWVIGSGLAHGNFMQPVKQLHQGFRLNHAFAAALGFASMQTIYTYLGYYNVCHLGGEIKNPQRNIPRSMFISIAGIALLYLLMNISVASVLPHRQIAQSKFAISEYIQALHGNVAAKAATLLVLWVAFASVFSTTLGYSRIPYAAAKDGVFFSVFAKLHPTKNFPYMSLLILGSIAFIFSLLFKIKEVISGILAMRILVQFAGQAVGLLLLSNRKGRNFLAWRMPLYPLPAILAIIIWLGIFYATGKKMMLFALGFLALGTVVFLMIAAIKNNGLSAKAYRSLLHANYL